MRPQADDGSVACLVVCFNELERIPGFLKYYREHGVKDFWFIDNNSNDGSFEYLSEQPDVSLLRTESSYTHNRKGLRWSRRVADEWLSGRWVLTVDVDELFVWPGIETVPFSTLIDYLDHHGYEGVLTLMHDFFPVEEPWVRMDEADSFLTVAPGLICDNLNVLPARHFPHFQVRGGIRVDMVTDRSRAPIIQKLPLLKWDPENYYLKSTHYLKKRIKTADLLCGLAHFKFSQTSAEKFRDEVQRGQRWRGGKQYRDYINALEIGFEAYEARVREVHTFAGLEEIGAVAGSPQYNRFLASNDKHPRWLFEDVDFQDLLGNWETFVRLNSPQFDDYLAEDYAYTVDTVDLLQT